MLIEHPTHDLSEVGQGRLSCIEIIHFLNFPHLITMAGTVLLITISPKSKTVLILNKVLKTNHITLQLYGYSLYFSP